MALKATIFKADLQISDINRNHYQQYLLTLARHPSETDERMMIRLLAFALNADERLAFTKGLSTDDEPDLWKKSLSDEIELWIELGQPDEKRIRRACGRAKEVIVYPYSERSSIIWWQQFGADFNRFNNLSVVKLMSTDGVPIDNLSQRNMNLTCTVQDNQIWLSDSEHNVTILTERLY
ncbi:MAG: YaeQ family protein [Candidatus Thiodiazotropha sp. (ex Monitilora ramsayi)]|nr:YaeQ family protein [Candidatus Thiodiazotropha sp. (ex Monitilora ramsayi)]